MDKKLAAHRASVGWFEDKPLTYVWADFRDALTARFLPPRYLKGLKDDYRALSQNGRPVMAYANRVSQLGGQLRKSDEDKLEAFLFGLDVLIKYDVEADDPKTFDEAVRLAQLQELKHNKGKPKSVSSSPSSVDSARSGNGAGNANKQSPKSTPSQSNSSQSNSSQSNSSANAKDKGKGKEKADKPTLTPDEKVAQGIIGGTLSKDERTLYAKEGRCFKCHTKGHRKNDCPKSKTPSLTLLPLHLQVQLLRLMP